MWFDVINVTVLVRQRSSTCAYSLFFVLVSFERSVPLHFCTNYSVCYCCATVLNCSAWRGGSERVASILQEDW